MTLFEMNDQHLESAIWWCGAEGVTLDFWEDSLNISIYKKGKLGTADSEDFFWGFSKRVGGVEGHFQPKQISGISKMGGSFSIQKFSLRVFFVYFLERKKILW